MNITLSEPTKVNQFASIMKNLKNFSQDVEFVAPSVVFRKCPAPSGGDNPKYNDLFY